MRAPSTISLEKHKWNNHFYEMKGDVRMSHHETLRKQEDALHNPIPTSLFRVANNVY